MRGKLVFLFLTSFFCLVCSLSCTKRTEWVASVGNQRISQADVELRKGIVRLSNPKTSSKEALQQLIEYKVGNEILQLLGHGISQKDLLQEIEKIKKEAKGNKSLAAVLRSYQHNPSFSEVYLYPRIVASKINELYENDKAFNEKELAVATTLLNKAKANPEKFEALAGEMGLPFFRGWFSEQEKEIVWETPRGLASADVKLPKEAWFSQKIKNEFLSKTGPQQVYGDPIPFWFGYLILRKDLAEKNAHAFSASVAPRKGRWTWVNQKSHWLPITKFDGVR